MNGHHLVTLKFMSWPVCSLCGLVMLKNDATRRRRCSG